MKRKIPLIVLGIMFLALGVYSGWQLYLVTSEYSAGEDTYTEAAQFVSLPDPTPTPTILPEATPDPHAGIVWPEVDFDALLETAPDVVGWIYLPDSKINYPIVQAEDNNYYMYRLYDGTGNGSGSIFMDFRNTPDFSDMHSILYGHHMNNGSMFAGITKYKKQAYYDEHPYCLLLTPNGNYKVEFFAGHVASVENDLVAWDLDFENEEEFAQWLDRAISKSTFQSTVEVSPTDKILTLSTCSYEFNNARYVLLGVIG